MSSELQGSIMMAGGWFFLKLVAGPTAHQWVGSVLAFSVCGIVASTIGFDVALFFGGSVTIVCLLRIFEVILGSGVYDLVILALIAAYHTKPAASTFDGRPMREMMASRKELKEKMRVDQGLPPKKSQEVKGALDGFLAGVVAGGKQLVKDVMADVTDAAVPIVFRDFHVLVVAEARFSEERQDENVFYLGCYGRWFNANAKLTSVLFDLDSSLRKQMNK
mmetsp:Transcript_58274/g.117085  ORF Transcript_58274/g.117085 Transcript_58274/m.117085 type:complete len:220 (-) Transcript_58274:138-797(-)